MTIEINSRVIINTDDFYKGKKGTVKRIADKTAYNIGVMMDEPNRGMIVWFTESELELIK